MGSLLRREQPAPYDKIDKQQGNDGGREGSRGGRLEAGVQGNETHRHRQASRSVPPRAGSFVSFLPEQERHPPEACRILINGFVIARGCHTFSPARKYAKSRREPSVWFSDSPDGQRGKRTSLFENQPFCRFPLWNPFDNFVNAMWGAGYFRRKRLPLSV